MAKQKYLLHEVQRDHERVNTTVKARHRNFVNKVIYV